MLVWVYNAVAKSGRDLPVAAKYALGFGSVAAGYLVFTISGRYAVDGRVSSWFMVWGYGLYSLGELLVSGLGLAMIARYVPARMSGFMMGAYFVATGVSQYLGSVVANFAQMPSHELPATESLPLYLSLFEARLARRDRHGARTAAAAADEPPVAPAPALCGRAPRRSAAGAGVATAQ